MLELKGQAQLTDFCDSIFCVFLQYCHQKRPAILFPMKKDRITETVKLFKDKSTSHATCLKGEFTRKQYPVQSEALCVCLLCGSLICAG